MTKRINISVPDNTYSMIEEYNNKHSDATLNTSNICDKAIRARIKELDPEIKDNTPRSQQKPNTEPEIKPEATNKRFINKCPNGEHEFKPMALNPTECRTCRKVKQNRERRHKNN